MYFKEIETDFRQSFQEDFDSYAIDGNGADLTDYVVRILRNRFDGRHIIRSLDTDVLEDILDGFRHGIAQLDEITMDYQVLKELTANPLNVAGTATSVSEQTPNDIQQPFISTTTARSINARNTSRTEMGGLEVARRVGEIRIRLSTQTERIFQYAFENMVA